MKAVWNGQVIAESDGTVVVEGNLRREFVAPSALHSTGAWKGTASYYSLPVNGRENRDAAWKGVQVTA